MKTFLNSAFGLNLISVITFTAIAIMFASINNPYLSQFFATFAVIFGILLPACSTKK